MRGIIWAAFGLTVLATGVAVSFGVHNPRPVFLVFWPWICLAVLFAALPLWRQSLVFVSAVLLVAYIFAPYSMSIGIFYIPAAVLMIVASVIRLISTSSMATKSMGDGHK
jgi:hypothetical protein